MLFSMGLMQKDKWVTGSFLAFLSQENAWETMASGFTSQFCCSCATSRETRVVMYLLNWTILSLWLLQYAFFRLNKLSLNKKWDLK